MSLKISQTGTRERKNFLNGGKVGGFLLLGDAYAYPIT